MPGPGEFNDADDFWAFESSMRSTLVNRKWKQAHAANMEEQQLVQELDPWISEEYWNGVDREHVTLDWIKLQGCPIKHTDGYDEHTQRIFEVWNGVRYYFEPYLEWGFWRTGIIPLFEDDEHGNPLPIGYGRGGPLKVSHHHTSSSVIEHVYSEKPDPITWEFHPEVIDQGAELGLVAWVGIGKFSEIEAVSQVPWIDPGLSSADFASMVLHNQMENQWQRKIDSNRIRAIQNFANGMNNTMFNPITLYVKPDDVDKYVLIKQDSVGNHKVEINFEFLKQRVDGNWVDYLFNPDDQDQRPIWLVDGQHRTRGFGASRRGSNMPVPIVLLMDSEGYEGDTKNLIARVFTEINTGAKPLEKLHKLFLKYEFEMESNHPSDNWINYNSDRNPVPADAYNEAGGYIHAKPVYCARANRRAYEAALYLASEDDSPLRNCIQFQKPAGQRRLHHIVINSLSWTDSIRKLFLPGNIYGGTQETTPSYSDELSELFLDIDGFFRDEIKNYLNAFVNTCNQNRRGMWTTGVKTDKQLFQTEGPFPVLIEIYPFIVKKILRESSEETPRPISREIFMQQLASLSNVNWKNVDLKTNLGGRTNLNRRHLKEWITRLIQSGEVPDAEQILSNEICGVIGQGLLAPPPVATSNIVSDNEWPRRDSPLRVRMPKPPNSLSPIWEVEYTINGQSHNGSKGRGGYRVTTRDWLENDEPTGQETYSELTIPFDALEPGTTEIRIKGSWKNHISQGPKFDELIIHRN